MDKSLWPMIAGIIDIIHSYLSSNIGLMVFAGISIFLAIGAGFGIPDEFV